MKNNLLKDWYIQRAYDGGVVIVGKIYNDTKNRFEDGTEIQTSAVQQADFAEGVIFTRNSVYHLEVE